MDSIQVFQIEGLRQQAVEQIIAPDALQSVRSSPLSAASELGRCAAARSWTAYRPIFVK